MVADIEVAKQKIQALIHKYDQVKTEGRISNYNEENTKAEFIEPLFEALGWDVRNTYHPDEVTREEKISKDRVDYSFRINGIPKFFLEAKALRDNSVNERKFELQAVNYSYWKSCPWAVLTDFKVLKVFNSEWIASNTSDSIFLEFRYHEFLEKFDDLWLLSRINFEQKALDKLAERVHKKRKRNPIDKQLLSDFTAHRESLSKNIVKNNKNINQSELDEAVQRILDRLVFIRYCEDRELEENKLRSNVREWKEKGKGQLITYLRSTFRYFNNSYNSTIFKERLCDALEIESEPLKEVIEGLYAKNGIEYDFSAIPADVLGNIYEQYLSHILRKTTKTAKLTESQAHRKEQGIYYTPTYIVDYIVRNTVGKLLQDKKIQADKIRVLDMACGSGSFLIKTFDLLNEYHIRNDEDYTQTTLDLTTETGTYTKRVGILQNSLFGVDLDRQAVEIAQLNLLLKIAERSQRLPLLQQNIKQGNSLIDSSLVEEDRAFNWQNEFRQIMSEGGFDVIVGNPPYVKLQTLDKNQIDYFYSNYKAATKHYDIYTLFVERALSLLKEGGIIGFILPSKFLNADYGIGIRKVLSESKSITKIVNFKDFQVFDGATTYTCLLFLRKGAKSRNFEYYEVSDKKRLEQEKVLSSDVLRNKMLPHPQDESAWSFNADASTTLISKLQKVNLTLADVAKDIFQGFLTGRDRLFFVRVIEDKGNFVKIVNSFDDAEHTIEKGLLKKLLKGKEIRRWQIEWRGHFVIYPYEANNEGTKLMPIEELRVNFPKAYRYFLNYKKELMDSETSEAVDETNWFRFRRARSIEQFESPKILTQVLASSNSFCFDHKGEFYFVGGGNAGGFGIILKEEYVKEYSIFVALLNSKVLEFYLKKTSTPFQHGFYSYGKKFIDHLPIVIPSGAEKDKLRELSMNQLRIADRISQMSNKQSDKREELEEEAKRLDTEIDEVVYKLYRITEEEKKIIEASLQEN